MKVNSIDNNSISFNGLYNNKGLKHILKFAADNSYLFAGLTSFGMAVAVKTPSILLTPKTDKINKEYATAKSLSSATINFLITMAVALPFGKSIQKIDTNPQKYLKKETIKNLQEKASSLKDSKAYSLATELFKLGLGIIVAAPKAVLNALSVPLFMDMFFPYSKKEDNTNDSSVNFKGKDNLAKGIGKIIDTKNVQSFSKKYKDTNFPLHMLAITDTITTASFIQQTKHNKKINDDRKSTLVWYSAISTTLSIVSGYILNKILDKPVQKFTDKFIEINKNDADLKKYIKGIKIAKPIFMLAGVYYIIIPIISTFCADKLMKIRKE